MTLTPAQERVYRFVQDYLKDRGYSPSYEEIREHLGFRSLNAVYKHLKQLQQRGYLQSPPKTANELWNCCPFTPQGFPSLSWGSGGGNPYRSR